MFHFIFCRSFSWSDNTVSQRSTQLTLPVVKLLFSEGKLSDQTAHQIMCSVLHGLEVQGEHDSANTSFTHLGASLYDSMRPSFPILREVNLTL
jgi:hypothetical protein